MIRLQTTIITGCVTVATVLHAGVYIVDNQHPQSADTNPGTREAPLKSVSAAAARAVAGDTVLVRPGLYREAVTMTNSGALGQPIVFRSEAPWAAVICGSDVVTNLQAEAPGVWSFSAPGLRAGGVDAMMRGIIGPYNNGEWVYVNGAPLDNVLSADLLLPGSFWFDFAAQRVQIALPEGLTPAGARVEFARRTALFGIRKPLDDIHIVGFTLLHGAGAVQGQPSLVSQGQRWVMENNHILWDTSAGLSTAWSRQSLVRNNLVEWCGNSGVGGLHLFDLSFESNTVRYCNWRCIDPGFNGGGSKWVAAVDSRLRGNAFYGHYGPGLWCDGANDNVLYEDNLVYANTAGIFSEISWDAIFRGNVCYNNNIGILVAETCGAVAEHNILFRNESGLVVRGNGRRPTISETNWHELYVAPSSRIPGVAPMTLERWGANYLKYAVSPLHGWMSNDSIFRENLIFDNSKANYSEFRNYARSSPMDPSINNFSDNNLWYAPQPESAFHSADGTYPGGLAGWQAASGRDRHSRECDPRTAGADLPAWAVGRRTRWEIRVRTFDELVGLQLGLVESPSAAALRDRLSRSAFVTAQPLEDAAIKAFVFEIDGERTLALWTTHPRERRYVRLRVRPAAVGETLVVENGYLQAESRPLEGGALDLVATYLPTYLRGVDETVVERPASRLVVRSFNPPGGTIPGTAVLANDADVPRAFAARFSAVAGYRVEPERVERELAPGASVPIALTLTPTETAASGAGTARMELTVRAAGGGGDASRLDRVAGFAFGTSGGRVPAATGPIVVDGALADWGALVAEGAPVGVVAETNQIANGTPAGWHGPQDVSARIYAAWTTHALYFAVIVRDDRVIAAPPRAAPWNFDAVELFVDGRSYDMQWQVRPTEGCYQIGISPAADGGAPNTEVFRRHLEGLQTAAVRTPDGYVIEAALPLSRLNFPADDWRAGRPIKVSVLVNDKDEPAGEGREATLGWAFSKDGANYGDTSGWRTLVLGE